MTSCRHSASLRDPAGYLVECGSRLIRVIRPEFSAEYREILSSNWLQAQCQSSTVATFRVLLPDEAVEVVGADAAQGLCLEHNVVSFPSFPSEWPLEMLCAAAELTLKLCREALQHGIGLKDATPFNVLFQGPVPVFVDLLSFEKRMIGDPTWLAYGQFVRSFLLPSLLDGRHSIPCHTVFGSHRDGFEPEEVYRLLSLFERFTPPFLGNVTMPVLLASKAERQSGKVYATQRLSNPEKATFILGTLFARLRRTVRASSTRRYPQNIWSTYNETCTYSSSAFAKKAAFLEQFFQSFRPAKVLDIGCNTGHFSFLAARYGAKVVATDLDSEVVGTLWQRAYAEKANILPLVVNLAQPTPAQGWRNRERSSFLERAEGYFDTVLMLAVVHHLLVTDQIPLEEIIEQAYRLTTAWMVIEYVGPEDPQFRRLLRGRGALYEWFERGVFEMELGKCFEIIRAEEIADTGRWIYLARRRHAR